MLMHAPARIATIADSSPRSRNSGTFRSHPKIMLHWDVTNLFKLVVLRLYRERRRVAFVTSLAFLAGFVMYSGFEGLAFGLPVPVFTGIVYALFVGVAAVMTSLLVPRLRHTLELVAISRLLFSVLVLYAPELTEPMRSSPLISATIVVGGAAWVQILLSRSWSFLAPAQELLAWLDDTIGRSQDQARQTSARTSLAVA